MVATVVAKDPTVVDRAERKLIEQYAGASLADSDPKEVQFIVEQSKIAGNRMYREKKFKGTGTALSVDLFSAAASTSNLATCRSYSNVQPGYSW